jgi:hypothetical protein
VQQALLDAWAGGAYPLPTGPAPDLSAELRPRIDTATDQLADALAALVAAGVPVGWSAVLAHAQGRALPGLPDGVTAVDLSLALDGLSHLDASRG